MYEYDKIGNMTYNCRYGYYHYEDTDHKHAVTRIYNNGQDVDNYVYDANGNMTSGAGRVLTYDYDNMPVSITYGATTATSVYDAYGSRVKKTVGSSTTRYIGQGYECDQNDNCKKYIYGGTERIAHIDSSDTYYYHTDHLGSSSVMTGSDGSIAQELYYYPYGEIKDNDHSNVAKHKFTGQEWDSEYGLYYYGARYYDPKLTRFISADTIVPESFNPQSFNRYSYTLNNPVIYVDPTGHSYGYNSDFNSEYYITNDINYNFDTTLTDYNNSLANLPNMSTYESYLSTWYDNSLIMDDPYLLAFNSDVHSGVNNPGYGTYTWALDADFSQNEALAIAKANQGLDDNYFTSPWNPLGGTQLHFMSTENAGYYVEHAIDIGRLEYFGQSLHILQDSYSHYSQGYRWYTGGHIRDGHSPDAVYLNQNYIDMRNETLRYLNLYRNRNLTRP